MSEHPPTLVHELWEKRDGSTLVCLAGPAGDAARASLPVGIRLAWVFDASSRSEAIADCETRMDGVTPTACELPEGPYTAAWADQQRLALAAAQGNRDTIAGSAAAQAWRDAADDLGIRFESPFALEYRGTTYWCAGWLPDFGNPKGTIIVSRHSLDDVFDVADEYGFYTSGLSPYYYESYDRKRFSETLNDWGWFGEGGDPPRTPNDHPTGIQDSVLASFDHTAGNVLRW